jgi:cystathionine beta-lyase family protein involved in aluminum resistance
MKTYPLSSITIEEAMKNQFKLVDIITRHFSGSEILTLGDLGVVHGINKPVITKKVEEVIAEYFNQEAAVLVWGAGTGAIRSGISTILKTGQVLLIHDAPVYPTTFVTLEGMGIKLVKADFNSDKNLIEALNKYSIDGALIQHTRQKIEDSYDIKHVIEVIKGFNSSIPILIDDNYAAMKVSRIGAEYGADLSCFSMFKLLGPEGVGCITGKNKYVNQIIKGNYSGGCQVQGHAAIEALRGLIYAPVALAIQSSVNEELVKRLNNGELKDVKNAFLANAQSKVLLVEFNKPIAKKVLIEAEKLGAAPNPVGAESKYEFVPMFYKVSGTFREADSSLEERMLRINPMRSGADTIIRILKEAISKI